MVALVGLEVCCNRERRQRGFRFTNLPCRGSSIPGSDRGRHGRDGSGDGSGCRGRDGPAGSGCEGHGAVGCGSPPAEESRPGPRVRLGELPAARKRDRKEARSTVKRDDFGARVRRPIPRRCDPTSDTVSRLNETDLDEGKRISGRTKED